MTEHTLTIKANNENTILRLIEIIEDDPIMEHETITIVTDVGADR